MNVSNNFHYLTNRIISRQNLWKDGIHPNNEGNNILTENFVSKSFSPEKLSAQRLESSCKDNIYQLEEADTDSSRKLRIENINRLITILDKRLETNSRN